MDRYEEAIYGDVKKDKSGSATAPQTSNASVLRTERVELSKADSYKDEIRRSSNQDKDIGEPKPKGTFMESLTSMFMPHEMVVLGLGLILIGWITLEMYSKSNQK